MVHITSEKQRISHRMKIVRGHVEKILKMVEHDAYCIDILNQSLAVQKSLQKIDMMVMEKHLRSCAIKQLKDGDIDKLVKELTGIYKYKL